ncbi:hypothetical protein SAMN03159496_01906 [Rhizobium sp. NFR07]|uniref:hypothetical protein n=1 Tax=Rhizobium sp. NFR07 TaxID=1566262 RepID=UPI0008E1641C|nr:hypothetical protein [Rhizobium sp. NFR07]SFB10799.1 hypothetical protein SAMN03159496_01906 [Rhizobium sp. NFR07]
MFSGFPKSVFEIIDANGQHKGTVPGVYSSDMIAIDDASASLVVGDELRRKLPNGTEEAFEIIDPVFYDGGRMIPAHFQVKIRRKGAFNPGTGGNYTIHVSGSNARVNLNSTDNSSNIVNNNRVFSELRAAISEHVSDDSARVLLLNSVDDMDAAKADKPNFLNAYQHFIATAADHITVVAPFLPALAPLLG